MICEEFKRKAHAGTHYSELEGHNGLYYSENAKKYLNMRYGGASILMNLVFVFIAIFISYSFFTK